MNDDLWFFEDCYLALLQLPLGSPLRMNSQKLLSFLRGRISSITGKSEHDVQDEFEGRAAADNALTHGG